MGVTYIPTGEGWLYLAIVKDLCTKKVVGYAYGDRINTELTMAIHTLAFQAGEEILRHGVVVGVSLAGHALPESIALQGGPVGGGVVLYGR